MNEYVIVRNTVVSINGVLSKESRFLCVYDTFIKCLGSRRYLSVIGFFKYKCDF